MNPTDRNGNWEDIEKFPQNRTLYVDQFTEDGPISGEDRTPFQARDLEDAFLHFKPCMDIELLTEEGESVTESFSFRSIDDFEDEQLIGQSEILNSSFQKIENYNDSIWRTERDKSLSGAELKKAIDNFVTNREAAEQNLQNNLSNIHDSIRTLEVAYRTLASFFANAGTGNASCASILNVRKKDLESLDSEDAIAIKKVLKQYYDRLDLTGSYSLFVLPGYLGDATKIREWANIACKNKVIMVTDFEDCHSFMDLIDALEQAHLQGPDLSLSNVIMTCNYLLGRKKSELADEEDDVYFPGSGALAGRLANVEEINIAQGAVGKEYGNLDQINGARLNLLKSEIEVLVNLGVIPMVEDEGHVMAFSNRSLYNGTIISLQEYPIVRVFDWVKKVLMNYMHEITLETWDPYKSSQKLKDKIQKFLNHYRGYKNLFSNYKLGDPVQDPESKIVTVDISITPFYIGKNFTIKLTADDKKNISAETTDEEN